MERRLSILFLWTLLAFSVVHADDWVLKPEIRDSAFLFGNYRIVLTCDSTRNAAYPEYTLRLYANNKLLAAHEGIGFERLFASPDHRFFLGVSNSGLTRCAYVVFDREGRILARQLHDPKKIPYQEMSISLVRKWYDEGKPGVEFKAVGEILREIHINGADGGRISLPAASGTTPQPGDPPDRR